MAKIKITLTPPPSEKGGKPFDLDLDGMSLKEAQEAFKEIKKGWTVKKASKVAVLAALVAGVVGAGVFFFRRRKNQRQEEHSDQS